MPVRVYSLIDVLKQLNQDSTQFLAPNSNELTSQFVQGAETGVLTPSWPNYKFTVLADAPLAYWKLDELVGQVWHDICGNYDLQIIGQIGTNVILGAADPISADQTGAAQLDGVVGSGYAAGANLVTDWSFEDVDDTALQTSWTLNTQPEWSLDRTTSVYGSQSLLCTRTVTTSNNWNEAFQAGGSTQLIPITPNAVYFASVWVKTNAGTVNTQGKVVWYKADGVTVSAQRSQDFLFAINSLPTWTNYTTTLTAPSDAAFASMHLPAGWWDGVTGTNTKSWFDGFIFCPVKIPTNLIADGGMEYGAGTISILAKNWDRGNFLNWSLDSTNKIAGGWSAKDTNTNASGWDALSSAPGVGTFPTPFAVTPNARYHVGSWFNQSEGTRQTHIKILWYQDQACTTFSAVRTTDFIVGGTDGAQPWTFYGGAVTAPSDAHWSILQLMSGYWGNLLTVNQASVETNLTGWAATLNNTSTQTAAQALDGTKSMQMSSTAAGRMDSATPGGLSGIPVTALSTYTGSAFFRSAATVEQCKVYIFWFTNTGAASSHPNDGGTLVSDTTSGWTQCTVTAAAPSDAAFAQLVVSVNTTAGAAEIHYVDEMGFVLGSRTGWPGVAANTWWDNAEVTPVSGLQGLTDFTAEAWVLHSHHTAGGNAERILHFRDSSATNFQGWEFNVDSNDKLNFGLIVNPNTYQTAVSTGTISLNLWHHVVAVRKGTNVALYIDGVLDSVTTGFAANEVVMAHPSGAHLVLGAWDCPPAFQSLWTGSLDEVAIYPYALTPNQVLTHFQAGARTSGVGTSIPYAWHVANDDGPTGFWLMSDPLGSITAFDSNPYTQKFPATVNGTLVFEKIGLPSAGGPVEDRVAGLRAAYFDGSTAYLDINPAVFDPSGTKSYTMETWFRPDVVDATFRRIMGVEPTVNHGVDIYMQNAVGFGTLRGDSGAANDVATGGTPAVAKWAHIVATYDGTNLKLYVDGELVATTASSRSADVGAAHLRIGGTTAGGTNGQGTYWGAAVYPVALTAAQVAAHFAWANPNLLTDDQASFEQGLWPLSGGGAVVARSTTYALDGRYSCSLASTSGSWPNIQLNQGRAGVPVDPSRKYTALANFQCDPGSPTRVCVLQLNWYKADGTGSSHPNDTAQATDAIGSWTQVALTIASPSDAAYVSIELFTEVGGAGEIHYIDAVSFAAGPSTTWTPGGRTATAGYVYGLSPTSRYGWFTYPNPPQRGGNRWGFAIWGSFLWG